uniref:Uncharacterized protein n=1 Tax=Oryza glumipatula TaxID=40148 RepID=A0A0D9ZVH0_9ORYZ
MMMMTCHSKLVSRPARVVVELIKRYWGWEGEEKPGSKVERAKNGAGERGDVAEITTRRTFEE